MSDEPETVPAIATLFERDPLSLSTRDLDLIIARYREARGQFDTGNKSAGNPKKVKAPDVKITNIDLASLGLKP